MTEQNTPPMSVDADDDGEAGAELATVHHLPAVRPALEGEVMTAQEWREVSQRQRAALRRDIYTADARLVLEKSRAAATHPHTRAVIRNLLYVPTGAKVLGRRVWDSRSTGRYERLMRSAELSGNHEQLAEWEARAAAFRAARHTRRMDMITAPGRIARSVATASVSTLGGLLALGVILAVADKDVHQVLGPVSATADLIHDAVAIVTMLWGPLIAAAPWLGLAGLWSVGRSSGQMTGPAWVRRLADDTPEGARIVTADGIVQALNHLHIAPLTKAIKAGWIPTFAITPIRDGRGYRAVFSLPLGVEPDMIADKRKLFARNLSRAELEVWPSDAGKADGGRPGDVDLWVADPGALSGPAPEYPLLHEGTGDVFEGVPVGVTQRGDGLVFQLVGGNFVAGGRMGQGKSNLCRVVYLGAALDPLAVLWVHVFAGNGDFDAYQPRLARYRQGATDEVAAAGLESLRELYEEVARREEKIKALGAKKLTRKIAEEHPDLRPLISLYSECHELFGHPEYGAEATELATKGIRRARKTGIVYGFDTQSSRKNAIPPQIVELVGINACFSVKSWRTNDGFLGDGSFQAGIRATELRFNKDRGTCLVTGCTDEVFEMVKTYFVEVDDDAGWDAATDVIARAVANLAPGTPIAALDAATPVEPETRDLLDDLDEVLGTEIIPIAEVPPLLRKLAPTWRGYRKLTGAELVKQLATEGVKVPSTRNRYPLDPVTVRKEIFRRSTVDLDE